MSETLSAPTLVMAALAGVIAAAQVLLDTAWAELAKRRERLEDLQARMAAEPEPPPSETPPKPKRAAGACREDAGMRLILLLQKHVTRHPDSPVGSEA